MYGAVTVIGWTEELLIRRQLATKSSPPRRALEHLSQQGPLPQAPIITTYDDKVGTL